MVLRCPLENGWVKLGQPVPLSNFVPPWNSGSPHRRQVKTPGRFSFRNTPQNGASVPCSRSTCFSSSLRSATSERNWSSDGGVRSKVVSAARSWLILWSFAVAAALTTAAAVAQPVETQEQALADDAVQYAAQFGVTADEARRRLKAQQDSVAATDAIAREFAGRLAGISIEHAPDYRIVVLLTGTDPVANRTAAGVPIVFRTGAKATHEQALAAMRRHLIDFRSDLPGARGAGYDQRTGEVVLLITPAEASRLGADAIRERAEEISGVPVRVAVNELHESNMSVDGGGRVEGLNVLTNRRNRCTTGFVVTNGEINAI